ncbi:MAG: damage-inducible protein DinB [Roseibium sp.]|uniref:DinB family protein n=1 Tax=Roseibium sp. TaxID=1936156 RepID=UPI002635C869|nr:DinB family protein [Roseibium sp.]MCV0428685.1 damage-inducible protein DinB [Roseibium sp.]
MTLQVDTALFQRMAAYNAWMTDKAYEAAEKMSDAERRQDRGAFFKSVHSTLNHILFADRVWMSRFSDKTYDVKGMGVDIFDDFSELKSAHLDMCRDIVVATEGFSSEWLSAIMEWTRSTDGVSRRRPRWLLVMHMFNHQTHHRGQLSTLFNQAGIDIGVTDLPFMPDLIEEFAG